MAKLFLEKEGVETVLFLLVLAEDVNGELSKRQAKLKRQCEKAGKPIKVSSGKAKGRELQKRICRDISSAIGIPYDQQDDSCLIHSREMGQSGIDVILRGKAKELFPFSIECKCVEALSLYQAIDQAISNQSKDTDWMVVHKRKGDGPTVVMSWDAYITRYKRQGYLL